MDYQNLINSMSKLYDGSSLHERELVVKWLRLNRSGCDDEWDQALDHAADSIEAGEHLKEDEG